MLSLDQAQVRVLSTVVNAHSERCSLDAAHGRIAADTVRSPCDVPAWDNSAMDGYAVVAADSRDGEVRLRLVEVIGAGQVATSSVAPGLAVGITTGAPVPDGADAIAVVEQTDGARVGEVRVRGVVSPGAYIRRRGEDIAVGDLLVRAGDALTPARLGLLASVGVGEVAVARRPRVALLATGDEVAAPGDRLRPGQIYGSNNVVLAGLIAQAGGEAVDLGVVPDDLDATITALTQALAYDVVITTGGVSVGAYDMVKPAYEAVGAPLDFWRVAIKPGKPLAFGVATRDGRSVPLFGLPGNPVSCFVNFLQFVRPWLRASLGDRRPLLPVINAVCGWRVCDAPGRLRLLRVTLSWESGSIVARLAGGQSSAVLSSVARAHGLMMLEPDISEVAAGALVRVQVFDPTFLGDVGLVTPAGMG